MVRNLRKLLLVSVPFLFGCDVEQLAQTFKVTTPTIIISPMTELKISDTETVYVSGYDKCLEQVGSIGCINLGKDVQWVRVTMYINQADVIEVWKVDHQGNKISLTRPNGFIVREPNQSERIK